MKYRVLDLFSGIGGFSLGLERTGGFETVAFCEIEDFPVKVLNKHWPNVPVYRDVRELTHERLRSDGIEVTCITAGFPCQDISIAGKGAGIKEGTRSGLWFEVARLIGELRPRYVVLENVSAILSRGVDIVLGDMAEIGYDCEWHCIPASAVGAHHRRDRWWCICYPHDNGQPAAKVAGGIAQGGDNMAPRSQPPGEPPGSGGQQSSVAHASSKLAKCTEPESHCKCSTSDDPWTATFNNGSVVPNPASIGQSGSGAQAEWRNPAEDTERQTDHVEPVGVGCIGGIEPGMGQSLNGLSEGLSGGRVDGGETETNTGKALQELQQENVSQKVQREAGGLWGIHAARLLQPDVYGGGLCIRHAISAAVNEKGKEVSDESMRELWHIAESTVTSHRPEPSEQLRREHPDLVHQLSCSPPPPCKACWQDGSWEDGVPRVAAGVPDRVAKLKALGNSVVPQIPEIIGRAIMERRK